MIMKGKKFTLKEAFSKYVFFFVQVKASIYVDI